MACCGKKKTNNTNISLSFTQQKLVEDIKKNIGNSAVKSNRSRPGSITKECPVCGSKSVASVCPICYYKF